MRWVQFRAMGCQMMAILDSEAEEAEALLARVPAWFETWEQVLSRFRPDSELSRLNARAGQGPVHISETLWQVLRAALKAAEASDGLVTPTVLPALQHAGYTDSFERLPRQQTAPATPPADFVAIAQAWRDIVLDPAERTVSLPAGVQLDLGGVAKGWAAETAARRLGRRGPALVDAGGDIAVSAPRQDGSPWIIEVASPFDESETLAQIALLEGVVVTSGRDYRRWTQDDRPRHHIIDPRTGEPADTDLVSVTVIARRAVRAEQAAKTILILGAEEGLNWLDHQRDIAVLLVREDGELFFNDAWPFYTLSTQ